MARVSGVDLPSAKRIDIALRYIYGIGPVISDQILQRVEIDPTKRVKDLNELEISKLNDIIVKNFKVEGDLRRAVQQNIRRLIDISSYRGVRHRRNLPLRGQRTKTNARTRRGKRKTVGAAKPGKEMHAPKEEE
ncbi:MAG: 30S ribosomal protein S13 [bacterium]